MGIILVTCSGLGITVAFDTEGPKLLPNDQQTKMKLVVPVAQTGEPETPQFNLLFDEPIRRVNTTPGEYKYRQ